MADKEYKIRLATEADTSGADETAEAVDQVTDATEAATTAADEASVAADTKAAADQAAAAAAEANEAATTAAAAAAKDQAEAAAEAADATDDLGKSVDDATDALDKKTEASTALDRAVRELREGGMNELADALEKVATDGAGAADEIEEAALKTSDWNSAASVLRAAGLGPLADAIRATTQATNQARAAKAAWATQATTTAAVVRTAFLTAIPIIGALSFAVSTVVSWFRRAREESDALDGSARRMQLTWPEIERSAESALGPIRQMGRELESALDTQRALARAMAALEDVRLATRLFDIDQAEATGEMAPLEAELARNEARQASRVRLAEAERELQDVALANQEAQIQSKRAALEAADRELAAAREAAELTLEIEARRAALVADLTRTQEELARLEADQESFARQRSPEEFYRRQLELQQRQLALQDELVELPRPDREVESLGALEAELSDQIDAEVERRKELAAELEAAERTLTTATERLAEVRDIAAQEERERQELEDRVARVRGEEAEAKRREQEAAERERAAAAAAAAAEAAASSEPELPATDETVQRALAVADALIADQQARGAGDRQAVAALARAADALRDGATADEVTAMARAVEQALTEFAATSSGQSAELRGLRAKVDTLASQIRNMRNAR